MLVPWFNATQATFRDATHMVESEQLTRWSPACAELRSSTDRVDTWTDSLATLVGSGSWQTDSPEGTKSNRVSWSADNRVQASEILHRYSRLAEPERATYRYQQTISPVVNTKNWCGIADYDAKLIERINNEVHYIFFLLNRSNGANELTTFHTEYLDNFSAGSEQVPVNRVRKSGREGEITSRLLKIWLSV